ncbi:hypothetical protein M0R45_008314 [Rubus argutus]|uniref:Uncharacterized protein n=1 Tax=Rubus argutus TaxID=59490 RepID=A0AAW1Y0F7_RUBAR
MASSSRQQSDIPFEDDEVVEAMSVEFEQSFDFLDLEGEIHLLGILIADEEPGMGGVKATLSDFCCKWKELGALLGSVLEVEDPVAVGYRGFLRLRVDLDARKPLPTSCRLPSSSITRKIRLQYENLKNFCFHCGPLGHMKMARRYQLNPVLVQLGVVYDNSLVAEPVRKSFFTLPNHPIEFPYVRDHLNRTRLDRRNQDLSDGDLNKFESCSNIGNMSKGTTFSRVDVDLSLGSPVASGVSEKSLSPALDLVNRSNRQRQNMWHPDTNDTIFRNGSVTLALNGLSIESCVWADPECIPLWAFWNEEEFKRANPLFLIPGFDNDSVLVPDKNSSIKIVELDVPHPAPLENRKRKAKKSLAPVADLETSQQKRPKNLYSPGLRLSNLRGRGRGSTSRGRGRKTTKKEASDIGNMSFFEANLNGLDTEGVLVADSKKGGLSLWWRPDVSVDCHNSSKFFIDTTVTFIKSGVKARITWIYGPPYYADKAEFWGSWTNKKRDDWIPWMVIGDLNEMLWQHEMEGGVPWSSNRCIFLRHFLDTNNLIDIGFKGQRFTWAKKAFGDVVLQERLDRSLINDDWLLAWPESCVTHLTRIGSDHCPLLFEHCPILEKRQRSFKFEAFWADDEECLPLIEENWSNTTSSTNQDLWKHNLISCRNHLTTWKCFISSSWNSLGS